MKFPEGTMPTIKISLAPETYESLSAVAVRERRAISGQAFVLLRGSLGLPFPPDAPRHGKDGKPIKYEMPAKAAMRLDMGVGQQELLKDPQVPLWIGEGIKKNDAMRTHDLCAVALLGVYN